MNEPTTIDFGIGVLHLDVLRARLRRKRSRLLVGLVIAFLLIAILLTRPYFMAQLLGQGTLALTVMPTDATLTLDDQQLSNDAIHLLSGTHTLRYGRPGFYAATLSLVITRGQTTTLALPALRPRPTVQPVPLPGVGAIWQAAAPDGDGWRLISSAADLRPTPAPYSTGAPEPGPVRTLLRLDALGLTRLAALEAYTAVDERTTAAGTSWAAYEVGAPERAGWQSAAGRLTIRWPSGSTVLTPTAPIGGLWWAPDGQRLLVALERGAGQDLTFWLPGEATLATPIVTIPGRIVSVQWHPSGRSAVVLSTHQLGTGTAPGSETSAPAWEATLLLPATRATESARALRLAAPPSASLGLIPLAWDADALLWVTVREPSWELQRIPFSAALPTRMGAVPAGTLALHLSGDRALRLLVHDGSTLTLCDWANGAIVLTLDDVPPTPGMSGAWQGDTLVLATEHELWYLTFSPAALV